MAEPTLARRLFRGWALEHMALHPFKSDIAAMCRLFNGRYPCDITISQDDATKVIYNLSHQGAIISEYSSGGMMAPKVWRIYTAQTSRRALPNLDEQMKLWGKLYRSCKPSELEPTSNS